VIREEVTTEGVGGTLLRVMPNNALQPLLIHDTAQPLVPYCLHDKTRLRFMLKMSSVFNSLYGLKGTAHTKIIILSCHYQTV